MPFGRKRAGLDSKLKLFSLTCTLPSLPTSSTPSGPSTVGARVCAARAACACGLPRVSCLTCGTEQARRTCHRLAPTTVPEQVWVSEAREELWGSQGVRGRRRIPDAEQHYLVCHRSRHGTAGCGRTEQVGTQSSGTCLSQEAIIRVVVWSHGNAHATQNLRDSTDSSLRTRLYSHVSSSLRTSQSYSSTAADNVLQRCIHVACPLFNRSGDTGLSVAKITGSALLCHGDMDELSNLYQELESTQRQVRLSSLPEPRSRTAPSTDR